MRREPSAMGKVTAWQYNYVNKTFCNSARLIRQLFVFTIII